MQWLWKCCGDFQASTTVPSVLRVMINYICWEKGIWAFFLSNCVLVNSADKNACKFLQPKKIPFANCEISGFSSRLYNPLLVEI